MAPTRRNGFDLCQHPEGRLPQNPHCWQTASENISPLILVCYTDRKGAFAKSSETPPLISTFHNYSSVNHKRPSLYG
jgi:hypothetical protein